jgi:hypothetical protein
MKKNKRYQAKTATPKDSLVQQKDNKIPRVDLGKIIIPVNKTVSFKEQIKNLITSGEHLLDESNRDVFKNFLGIGDLTKAKKGTSIPFISTITGNFLVNPCPINPSTFKKMVDTDDIIARCQTLMISDIVNRIGEYYNETAKIQKFIRYAFKCLKGGRDGLVRKICTAIHFGHWVAVMEDIRDKNGYTIIENIRHLPQVSIQYTVTLQGDIDNIWQYIYNYPYTGTQNALSTGWGFGGLSGGVNSWNGGIGFGLDNAASLGSMDYPFRTNFINTFGLVQLEKKKTLHFAYGVTNGKINPYGDPILQAGYPIWINKQVARALYQSAMGRCANPMVVVYADANKAVYNIGAGDINAVEAAYTVMQTYSEDTAVILPGRKGELFDIEVVANSGNFDVYEKALTKYDADLEKLHLVPEGIFSTATTFAGATAQNSIFTKLMGGIAEEMVQHVLLDQVVKYLIIENFGESYATDLGYFESELQNIDDKLKYQKLYEGMTNDGYLDNTNKKDIQHVRKTLGEPTLDEEGLNALIKRNLEKDKKDKMDNNKKVNSKEVGDHYTKRSVTDV